MKDRVHIASKILVVVLKYPLFQLHVPSVLLGQIPTQKVRQDGGVHVVVERGHVPAVDEKPFTELVWHERLGHGEEAVEKVRVSDDVSCFILAWETVHKYRTSLLNLPKSTKPHVRQAKLVIVPYEDDPIVLDFPGI